MAGERTEAATPRRRREARNEGQVGKSHDLTVAIGLVAAMVIIQATGAGMFQQGEALTRHILGSLPAGDITLGDLNQVGSIALNQLATMMLPLMIGTLGVTLIAGFGQVGLIFTAKTIMPQFSRINPGSGIKRIFSLQGGVELLKAVVKMAIVGGVAYTVLNAHLTEIASAAGLPPMTAYGVMAGIGLELALKCALTYLIVAALDYFYQRWQFEQSIRMSKDEIKQEFKQQEGNPEIKGRIRQLQRQIATRRMMSQVKKADVVITNPTHYAVAIAYDGINQTAPVVLAKGVDLIAQQIKKEAAEHNIPMVENVPLARALYAAVDLDQEIPAELYQAVAEVLAFIFKLRGRR